MRISRMKKLLTMCLAGCLIFALSSVTFAAPPLKGHYGPFQVLGAHIISCGDFDVLWSGTLEGRYKVFSDKDGNFIKYFEHIKVVQHDSTYYNSKYPEISVSGGPGENETQRWYSDGRVIIVGLRVKIRIPGSGVVVHEAGRVIFDSTVEPWEVLVQSGPSDVSGDTTALCELLAH